MTTSVGVTAAIFALRSPERLLPTVISLRTAHPEVSVVLGAPKPSAVAAAIPGVDQVYEVGSLAELINLVASRTGHHLLAISDAVVVPASFLNRAIDAVDHDMRVATVSFLANAADHLSFPHRNSPSPRGVDGADELTVTRRLRELAPEPAMAPIPLPGGAVVLISAHALGAVGALSAFPSGSMASTIEDFSLRARRRGFVDLLDSGTYVTRPVELSTLDPLPTLATVERQALMSRFQYFPALMANELGSVASPISLAFATARAKVTGLQVVIEAGCLGPLEMGTQVQTLALIEALAKRPDVARVGVALATDIPSYAQRVLRLPKVEPRRVPNDDFSVFGQTDIAHRSYQPDRQLAIGAWRRTASRGLITVQDMIAYHVGAYHGTAAAWLAYRDSVRAAARGTDGLVVVSEDTREQLIRECLPLPPDRLFVVANGTDHLTGHEAVQVPTELVARGAIDGEYVLMLGADYAHKNRDLGLRAWQELRRRGWRHNLVLAGAQVSYGSSRLQEAEAGAYDAGVLTLPDVATEERNWLLRHASLLLYPTSAEGFGLVPYEAARFGTPTVAVAFGPLREVASDAPVWAEGWTPDSLADAAEVLLRDPALAREQVSATIAAGSEYRWDDTAARLVEAYRIVLSQPPRS